MTIFQLQEDILNNCLRLTHSIQKRTGYLLKERESIASRQLTLFYLTYASELNTVSIVFSQALPSEN